jgi:hypothetical protein
MSSSDPVPFRRLHLLRILSVRHPSLLPVNERHTRPDFWKLKAPDGTGPGLAGDHGTCYSAYGDPATMRGHHAGSLGVSGRGGWLSQDLGDSPGGGGRWRGLSVAPRTSRLR